MKLPTTTRPLSQRPAVLLALAIAALGSASAHAQTAPALDPNDPQTRSRVPSRAETEVSPPRSTDGADSETITLSPFEVKAENTGYFQSNTMSGTRLNSKIEDLGQSITVMTKEQMVDFAMLDVNDVFDYMASTEGTNSYSDFVTDRTGAVVDNVSLNPNNANRVRGIGNANIAFNNIAMSGRVPVDPLWMDSLELSRGPNANIFGLGNASGTVNQVPATANVSRDFTRLELRGDDYGGWRGSLDVNRTIFRNKLAIRASYANQHTAFIRKPSGEDARRLSFQVKAQPWKNTTISASWYNYNSSSVRPNFTTPRDYYTDWFEAGRPGWNPVTRLVTLANGEVYGNGNVLGSTTPYTAAPTRFFTGGAESRSPFQIGAPGEAPYWTIARYTGNPATPAGNNFSVTDPYASSAAGIGLLTTGASDTYTATQQPLYNSIARPIFDKSIYNWDEINLMGNSKAWDKVDTYLAQIDQIILNTARQTLAAQVTYLREDAYRLENQPMGRASVNSNVGQLQVDVNTHYLDGTPNPYFGRPYLRSSEPFLRLMPVLWETARAQAVYKFDFTQEKNLLKWLGTQQVLGYYEYKDQKNYNYNYRHTALNRDVPWLKKYADLNAPLGYQTSTNLNPIYLAANGTQQVGGNYSRLNEQYYVGSTVGGPIEYGPSYFPEGVSLPYVWGPSANNMFKDVSAVGWSPGYGGGLINVNTVVKTVGGVLQSMFLDGKLVTTFGLREDTVNDRNSPLALLTSDLRDYDFDRSNTWSGADWRTASGKTKTASVVVRPFRDFQFVKSGIENGSGITKLLAEAVGGLSLTYNKSDNFIAQGPAYDLFLKRLPNQTGKSEDIGFWLTLLDGKLSIRYTNFKTTQLNLRNGDISTMAQRILRYEGFVADDAWNLRKQTTAWLNGLATGGTATDEQIAAAIKMDVEQYKGLKTIGANQTYAAVNDMESKGEELEINYNPTKHWTVSGSVTRTQAINTAAGAAVDDYIKARMPVWTTLEDPRFTQTTATINGVNYPINASSIPTGTTGHLLWWHIMGAGFSSGNTGAGYNATNSAATNFAGNVDAPMAVFRALIGRPRPQIREYSVKLNTKYNLAGLSDNKVLKNTSVGGSLRYASKSSIGFYGMGYSDGMDLTLPQNRILNLDPDRPIYAPSETFVDLFVTYNVRLFNDKVRARFQLNVKNVFEDGGTLQATQAFFDGKAATYRIVDPRQFILSASFDL